MSQDIYILYFFNDDLPINQLFIAASDNYACIETLLYKSFNDIIKVLCKKEGYELKRFSINIDNYEFILSIEDNRVNQYHLTIPFYKKKYLDEEKEIYYLGDDQSHPLCLLSLSHIILNGEEEKTFWAHRKLSYHNNIFMIEDNDIIIYYDKDYYCRDNIEYYPYPIKLGLGKRIKK